jgi:type I restriction enzyme M protein
MLTGEIRFVVEEHFKNNLPDLLARWGQRDGSERERPRTAQRFLVPKAELAANGYDLSLNRYKEVVHEAVDHLPPQEILTKLAALETQIQQGMQELEAMLNQAK